MAKKKHNFDTAFERLQEVLAQLQSENIKIEQMNDLVREAHELHSFCTDRLRSIEQELQTKETNTD